MSTPTPGAAPQMAAEQPAGERDDRTSVAVACAVIPLCPHGKNSRECLPCMTLMLEDAETRQFDAERARHALSQSLKHREKKHRKERADLLAALEEQLAAQENYDEQRLNFRTQVSNYGSESVSARIARRSFEDAETRLEMATTAARAALAKAKAGAQ